MGAEQHGDRQDPFGAVPIALLSLREDKSPFLKLLEKAVSPEVSDKWLRDAKNTLSNIRFIEGPLIDEFTQACEQFLIPNNDETELGTALKRVSIVLYFASVSPLLIAVLDEKISSLRERFPEESLLANFENLTANDNALGIYSSLEIKSHETIIETFTSYLIDTVSFLFQNLPQNLSELHMIRNVVENLFESDTETLLFVSKFYTLNDTHERFNKELERLLSSKSLYEQITAGALLGGVSFYLNRAFPPDFETHIKDIIINGDLVQATRIVSACLCGLKFSASILREEDEIDFDDDELYELAEDSSLISSFIDDVQNLLDTLNEDTHSHVSLRKFLISAVLVGLRESSALHTQSADFDLTSTLTLDEFKELLARESLVADIFCRYGIFKGVLSAIEAARDGNVIKSLLECLHLGLTHAIGELPELIEQVQTSIEALEYNPTLKSQLELLFINAVKEAHPKSKQLLIEECITKLSNEVSLLELKILTDEAQISSCETQKLSAAIDLFLGIPCEDLQQEKLLPSINTMKFYLESLKDRLPETTKTSQETSTIVNKINEALSYFDDILSQKK